MKFTLKNTFAGRYFFFLGIVFIILTLFAAYLLSDLITQVSEKTNAETTQRGFLKRHEIIAAEFSRLLQTPKEVDRIIKFSNSKNLSEHLKVLGTIHNNDSLVKNSWFQINDNKIEFAASKDPKKLETAIRDFILKNGDQKEFSTIINNKEEFFWRIYSKSNSADGSVIRYGYDIDLKSLQSFFSTIDQNTPNYAFVFDQKGTVLYHPEVKLLQQNIFKITNITPADTSFAAKESFSKKTALSEYLKLDIVRYTKRLDVKGTSWYVCVNFPKEISNEDVYTVKKYASLIYFLTTAILIVFFYFFTLFRRKSFREKEILAEDKNKLLVENEKVNKEKALILLQQLKEQINPHFLFNSLNSLYMLIESDTAVARKFTLNLSKIYRYLINPPDHNIVTLQEEMLFIEKYIFLQQTRFTAEFVFTINMEDENLLSKKVPYLAFQILVENAIKHNIASEDSPLHITIDIKENEVIIRNNLQEKSNPQKGSKFGHKYLKSIYKYYSKTEFKAYKNDGYFICILPLIA